MAIEIDGTEYRTEAQWERVHRHLRKNAKGVHREWNTPHGKDEAWFYPLTQTRKWTEAERNRERKKRREAEAEKKIRARIGEAVERAVSNREFELAIAGTGAPWPEFAERRRFVTSTHTAWQWVDAGFVPLREARWRRADNGYFYCRWCDVRWMPKRAEQLIQFGPREVDRLPDGRPYDGRPWWVY